MRISGPNSLEIGQRISSLSLTDRQVRFARFNDRDGNLVDTGLVIYFAAPKSFTGEDVVEIHGHGGPVIQDMLLAATLDLGARQARAGEFSERAFLNDKIDLAQAEAIADLIDSTTQAAARGAMRTLQGAFSDKVHGLIRELIELRVFVEAAIDFPEEEIDFLADEGIRSRINGVQETLIKTIEEAGQGAILRNGLNVVLAGKPNAGKSSLLNALAGEQTAIVTDVPGTTRDIIRQTISLDGLPLHLIDTAGLRETNDAVEQIGVARARTAINQADHILRLVDGNELDDVLIANNETLVINKVDLVSDHKALAQRYPSALLISVTEDIGIADLKAHLKKVAGYENATESNFTARRRHITALQKALSAVETGLSQLQIHNAGELLADELRQAQVFLAEITGEFSADDLLGEIFAGFCIGK